MRKLEKLGTWSRTFLLLSVLCFFAVLAQAQTVKGIVRDQNGDAIIGATVKVLGSRGGTVTDNKGQYSIDAPSGSILSISYVGYLTKQIRLRGENAVDVTLMEDNTTLNDIVVIGYGAQKKSDLTGSVASVKAEELKNLSTPDAGAALQGKASGVQIINGGSPGDGAKIRVRGYSSNSDKIDPLLIVDGAVVDNIQYLDPSLIESMEVLKDAASAAIYGAQAGNGVVLITTKNGANTGGTAKITYSLKAVNQALGKKAEIFNAADYIEYQSYIGLLSQDRLNQNNYNGQDTDWYDEVFDNSWEIQHNITAQGGNDKGHFLANIGILDNDGIVKGDKDVYKRFSAQVNGDYKFHNWISVKSSNNFEKWSRKALSNGYQSFLNSVVSVDPLTPVYVYNKQDMGLQMADQWDKKDGRHGTVPVPAEYTDESPVWYGTSKYSMDPTGNPIAMRDRSHGTSGGFNLRGSLEANLTPFDGFTYTSRLGYRLQTQNDHDWSVPFWLNSKNAKSTNYSISSSTSSTIYYQWENFANYLKTFGKHTIGAMVGMSFSKRHVDNTAMRSSDTDTYDNDGNWTHDGTLLSGEGADNFNFIRCLNDNGLANLKPDNNGDNNWLCDYTSLSYFGRLTYSFDDRYGIQANFRRDAFDNSKLSTDARWGTFPSFSAGWTISNESFFKNAVSENAVSFLKFRGSWGRNGNVAPLSGYQYSATVGIGGFYNFVPGVLNTGAAPGKMANPDLKWETSEQLDFGLDARFLRGRLSLGVDWYKKTTRDLLVQMTGLPEIGGQQQWVNTGEVLNQGFDIELGWRDNIGDFKYSINANVSTIKNEVQNVSSAYPRIDGQGISGFNSILKPAFEKGHPIWYYRGYEYAGVYTEDHYSGDAFDKEHLGKALYYDKDGKLTTSPDAAKDMKDIGSAIPKLTYGITLNFEYKGIDLSIFGTGAADFKIYNMMCSADSREINGLNVWWKNSTRVENGSITRLGEYPDMYKASTSWDFYSSSAALFDGSYFKFKQIQLGYTLPNSLTKKFAVSDLRFSVSLDDFFVITDYPGADPETSSLNAGQARGFDNGNYPMSKKVVFGVNLSF